MTPPRLTFDVVLRTSQSTYRLCVTDPHDHITCTTYPLSALNTSNGPAQVGQGPAVRTPVAAPTSPDGGPAAVCCGLRSPSRRQGPARAHVSSPDRSVRRVHRRDPGKFRGPRIRKCLGADPGGPVTPLTTSAIVPSGTIIDASQGPVSLITVLPDRTTALASLSGGVFEVIQDPSQQGLTTIDLRDASLAACTPGKGTLYPVREVAVIAGPEFRVNGRFVDATPTADADLGSSTSATPPN